MKIIFCCDPLLQKLPDLTYKNEYEAARSIGLDIHLACLEELLDSGNPAASIKNVPLQPQVTLAIYRGWMLKPDTYRALYNALLSKNVKLINSPESYRHCHYLPESYEIIKALTAKTIWFPKNQVDNAIDAVLQGVKATFGTHPIIIKDYVKSRKHEWRDACYIEDASDRDNLLRVLGNFLQQQGPELNEGVVFREFLKLSFLANHAKSNMPLTKEFRLFFFNGQLLQQMYYWDEGDYSDTWPNITPFLDIARKVQSSFFTMDIAQTENGIWKIIELGDGQVSGLPDNADLKDFYAKIKQAR